VHWRIRERPAWHDNRRDAIAHLQAPEQELVDKMMVRRGDLGNPHTLWTAARGVFEQGQGRVSRRLTQATTPTGTIKITIPDCGGSRLSRGVTLLLPPAGNLSTPSSAAGQVEGIQ